MSLIIPRQYKKRKAIVVSFPRSGTHFLMNTLSLNFGYQAVPYIDFSAVEEQYYGTNIAHWLEVISLKVKEPFIVKTHVESDFFKQFAVNQQTKEKETVVKIAKHWYDVFYIWRDMEPTMESYAKHLTATASGSNPRSNPVAESGAELAKMEPWGSPLFHQMRQYPTFKDAWDAHTKGWIELGEKYDHVHVVKYENLDSDFDNEVNRIAGFLKKPVLVPERPSRDVNVVKGSHFIGA
jgi:hypothetical protein